MSFTHTDGESRGTLRGRMGMVSRAGCLLSLRNAKARVRGSGKQNEQAKGLHEYSLSARATVCRNRATCVRKGDGGQGECR